MTFDEEVKIKLRELQDPAYAAVRAKKARTIAFYKLAGGVAGLVLLVIFWREVEDISRYAGQVFFVGSYFAMAFAIVAGICGLCKRRP